MHRSLAVVALAAGLALSAAPGYAKPEPIRGFVVTVKGDQIRASALVPGPAGRKAQLQQLDDGRWVTVAQTHTKRAKSSATPRARWRVAIEDLRLPSAQSRAQAGPLAELVRLRAQSGKKTSKPKKVRVKLPDLDPVMPKTVSGFIGSQAVGPGFDALWSGDVRFEYNGSEDPPSYNLVSANLTWKVEMQSGSCPINATGTFGAADLKGAGSISVPNRSARGKVGYNFTVTREAPVTIEVTCKNGQTTSFEYDLPVYLNTVDCPSASKDPRSIPSTYTGQPWTNRQPPYVFFGKVGINAGGFCSNTLEPPGIFQSWDLTGSDPFEFTDWLAPLSK